MTFRLEEFPIAVNLQIALSTNTQATVTYDSAIPFTKANPSELRITWPSEAARPT